MKGGFYMKPLARLMICLSMVLFVITLCFAEAQAVEFGKRPLKLNDEGPDVAILQFRLREVGCYKDKVDGVFGTKTQEGVKKFQKMKGLEADGVVGPRTYQSIPKSDRLPSRGKFSWDEVIFLARVIHAEARGESFKGQVAVGAVILNRVDHTKFPDTIRDVILQEGQFCTLTDGQIHLYPSKMAIEAAKAAILGYDPSNGALYFYNPHTAAKNSWIKKRPIAAQIGEHTFAF